MPSDLDEGQHPYQHQGGRRADVEQLHPSAPPFPLDGVIDHALLRAIFQALGHGIIAVGTVLVRRKMYGHTLVAMSRPDLILGPGEQNA